MREKPNDEERNQRWIISSDITFALMYQEGTSDPSPNRNLVCKDDR
jgi:hypothetical protein